MGAEKYIVKIKADWWVLESRNGGILATSEVYLNHSNAKRAGKKLGADLNIEVMWFDYRKKRWQRQMPRPSGITLPPSGSVRAAMVVPGPVPGRRS